MLAANYIKKLGKVPMKLSSSRTKTLLAQLSASVLLTKEKVINSVKSKKYLRVYLVFKLPMKRQKKQNIAKFFAQHSSELEACLSDQPVFFDKEKAIRYLQFKDDQYITVKAYIPETAIVGQYDELTVKRGFISTRNVYGLFQQVDDIVKDKCTLNLDFDITLLKYLKPIEEALS